MVLGSVLRIAGGLGLALALAACQPLPLKGDQQVSTSEAPAAPVSKDQAALAVQTDRQALNLRIFLASESPRPGWVQVNLNPQQALYVMADPVITRSDLVGIRSAVDNQSGDGILEVALSDAGLVKIRSATASYPGLRLALVVNKTMLAAPGYAAPVTEKLLAFRVGSRENAVKAARGVAGVDDPATSGL